MQPVILELYGRFLQDSADPELREYADPEDEVTANFVHRSYMSEADLAFCRGVDVAAFAAEPAYDEMAALHAALPAGLGDQR